MSVGDAVVGIQNIAGSAYLIFQPAAGVEVMITNIGSFLWIGTTPDQTHYINIHIYNGSIFSILAEYRNRWMIILDKYLFNNTNYLRIHNITGSAQIIHYSGVQIK